MHFRKHFRSCACGQSTRMFIIVHRFPAIFETLKPLKFLLGLKLALQRPPLAFGGVSAAVLLNLKQNLMQILCSLISTILILADTHENGVKKTAKTRKHVHL